MAEVAHRHLGLADLPGCYLSCTSIGVSVALLCTKTYEFFRTYDEYLFNQLQNLIQKVAQSPFVILAFIVASLLECRYFQQ